MVGSIYTTVVVALERYVAVSKPFNVYMENTGDGNILRWRKLCQYVGPVVVFSVFFNIPTFFEFQVISDTVNSTTSSRLMVTPLRENSVYILFYINLARIPITGLLPFLALCILNYLVYVHLVKRRKNILESAHYGHYKSKFNVEHRQAQTLFGVALIFFFGHLLRVALNLHEFLALQSALSSDELMRYGCYSRWPFWSMVSRSVSRLLMTTSSSANLLVYCAISGIFRNILLQSIRKLLRPFFGPADQHNQNNRVYSFSSACRRSYDTTVTSIRVTML
ncbi:hypothetical protein TCAL_16382 [Tigriopus californicus]|uniref:G-protein coupled receptors family 1 profile domain-containing protein n=1 Tax=Tigriopus californicus TaxID=6832 RepID=A0A553NZR0_TIGCA|nr:FMRFamide receptor-like [Tigriopus californicus]TRY70921.1 hypothetical protein TCAL_16382 [Tigriopus californicus]